MSKAKSKVGARPLSREDLAALKAIVTRAGDPSKAAKQLRIPRGTIASALSGFALREGTVLLIRERLTSAEVSP